MTSEEWRPVRDLPDYEISNIGGLRRATPSRGTRAGRVRKPRLLNGYIAYWISTEGKVLVRYAHRLVADAFLGPIPRGMQVNHKNGDRSDCRVDNLEIVTNAENRAHSYRTLGVKPNKPSVYGNAKLSWELASLIRAEYSAGGTSHSKLAAKYGVERRTILRLLNNQGWREQDRPATP